MQVLFGMVTLDFINVGISNRDLCLGVVWVQGGIVLAWLAIEVVLSKALHQW